MKKIIFALFDFFFFNVVNLFVFIINLFIWRNKRVWIFGGWFGEKYADNSRYLFQYVSDNKEKYGIKKAIWITRNKNVYDTVSKLGYDVLMANSLKSYFYHLRSGVHIICNNSSFRGQKKDIITSLSFGAKKIQLWHGVGIKACGRLKRKKINKFFDNLYYGFINRFGQPGMWGLCYQLATSDENKRVAIEDFAVLKKRVILASYPRLFQCDKITKKENDFLLFLKSQKDDKKIVLFLPTFRDNYDDYILPSDIKGFISFLNANSILWIQKKHSADKSQQTGKTLSNNVVNLDSDFDINLLLDSIDLVVTDFSSVSSDAIYKGKATLEYCPDFAYYKDFDRGFVNDYEKYHMFDPIINPGELFDKIIERLKENIQQSKRYEETKMFLFGDKKWNMDLIVETIIKTLRILRKSN